MTTVQDRNNILYELLVMPLWSSSAHAIFALYRLLRHHTGGILEALSPELRRQAENERKVLVKSEYFKHKAMSVPFQTEDALQQDPRTYQKISIEHKCTLISGPVTVEKPVQAVNASQSTSKLSDMFCEPPRFIQLFVRRSRESETASRKACCCSRKALT